MIDNLTFQNDGLLPHWWFVCGISHAKHTDMIPQGNNGKGTLSHDITSLSHQMAEQFKIMFCFPLRVGMGDIPCIKLYTKKYSVKISSLLTIIYYIYINLFFIQNLRVNWCCLENKQMLCRYSKCSVKAWKLWMLKDTRSCQSYDVIDPFSLFCEQIKLFDWVSSLW